MKSVLFIGSFKRPKEGAYGGVHFASTNLRSAMKFNNFEIIELDTTLHSIHETRVFYRLPSLFIRSIIFLWNIATNWKAKNLIVFVSAGNSYLDKLPSIILAKILGKNVILFPRSGFVIRDYENYNYKVLIGWVMKLSDFVVCQSDFWKKFFIGKKVSSDKLIVVENWVNEHTIAKSKEILFKQYLPGDRVYKLVYVSRIEIAKGVNDIVELAKILKDKFPLEISIYGDGSYAKELQIEIDKFGLNNIVKIKGWLGQKKMQNVINEHHVALFTSRFEGYPNALLDYIFSKIPIIAADIPTVKAVGRDLITYYDAGNSEQLAEKVIWSRNNYSEILKMAERLISDKESNNNLLNQTANIIKLLKQ